MLHEKLYHSFVVESTTKTIFFQVWDQRCSMYLEGSGLILLTRMSMLMLLTSVYVLVLFYRDDLMIFLAGIFVGVLTLIWSIIMV